MSDLVQDTIIYALCLAGIAAAMWLLSRNWFWRLIGILLCGLLCAASFAVLFWALYQSIVSIAHWEVVAAIGFYILASVTAGIGLQNVESIKGTD